VGACTPLKRTNAEHLAVYRIPIILNPTLSIQHFQALRIGGVFLLFNSLDLNILNSLGFLQFGRKHSLHLQHYKFIGQAS